MMAGQVTEFAKKKFENGNTNVAQYLAQVKEQVTQEMSQNKDSKPEQQQPAQAAQKTQEVAKTAEKAKPVQPVISTAQIKSSQALVKDAQKAKEAELNKQLHDSVQELLKIDKPKPEVKNTAPPAATSLANT